MHAKLCYMLFLKNIVKAIVGFTVLALLLLLANYSLSMCEHGSLDTMTCKLSLQAMRTKHMHHLIVNTSPDCCLYYTQSQLYWFVFAYFCVFFPYNNLYFFTQDYTLGNFISINITNLFSFLIMIFISISWFLNVYVSFCPLCKLLYYFYDTILLQITLAPYFIVQSVTPPFRASLVYRYGARVVGFALDTIRVYPPRKIITNIIGIVYNLKCVRRILLGVYVIENKHKGSYQVYLQTPYGASSGIVVLTVILMLNCALFYLNVNAYLRIRNWTDVLLLKMKYIVLSFVFLRIVDCRFILQVNYFWYLYTCNG